MTFQKGHTYGFKKGNKYGKGRPPVPKKDYDLVKLCKMETETCVKELVELVQDPKGKPSHKISAINTLLAYGWGRPKQTLDVNQTLDITQEFLAALQAINRKADDDDAPKQIVDVTPHNGSTADARTEKLLTFPARNDGPSV